MLWSYTKSIHIHLFPILEGKWCYSCLRPRFLFCFLLCCKSYLPFCEVHITAHFVSGDDFANTCEPLREAILWGLCSELLGMWNTSLSLWIINTLFTCKNCKNPFLDLKEEKSEMVKKKTKHNFQNSFTLLKETSQVYLHVTFHVSAIKMKAISNILMISSAILLLHTLYEKVLPSKRSICVCKGEE